MSSWLGAKSVAERVGLLVLVSLSLFFSRRILQLLSAIDFDKIKGARVWWLLFPILQKMGKKIALIESSLVLELYSKVMLRWGEDEVNPIWRLGRSFPVRTWY